MVHHSKEGEEATRGGIFENVAYSQSWIGIRMKDRKSTHCTDKNTHWMSIMGHRMYNILHHKIAIGSDFFGLQQKAGTQHSTA